MALLDLPIDCGGVSDNYYEPPSLTTNFGVADVSGLTDAPTGAQIGNVRYVNTGGTLTYKIPVTAGKRYRLRLYFSESDGATETRIMNIDINGVRAVSNYAPYIAAGNVYHKAVVLDFTFVNPTSILQIDFLSVAIQPIVGFIRVKEIAEPPADITGLVATVVSATQINLDWDDILGATYAIEYSANADFSGAVQTTSSVSNKSITGILPDTIYYFRVKAVKDGAQSLNWSGTSAVTPEAPTALDEYFERFFLSEIFNITQLDLEMPVLRADFGNGYEAAALSGKASGLRYWTISADVLPDLSEYSIDYSVDGDDLTDSRFQYFWEFYRRHLSLGNKPFYFVDTRTNRKFLASFVDSRISFESITAKLYRGGVTIKQRRVKNSAITFRAEDGSVSN